MLLADSGDRVRFPEGPHRPPEADPAAPWAGYGYIRSIHVPWHPPFDARRAHRGLKSPQKAPLVAVYVRLSHFGASCIRERLVGGLRLTECVAGTYISLTYSWRDVSTLLNNIMSASKRTLVFPRCDRGGHGDRSTRDEFESLSSTAVASMTTATIPMHRAAPRPLSGPAFQPAPAGACASQAS